MNRNRTNRWTGATGSEFRIKRDPAKLLGSAVARSTQPLGARAGLLMRKMVITGLVAVHLAATLWHGSLHSRLSINLSPSQTLFIIIVILMAPIVAAALVWTRYVSIGLWLFFLSMLAAFLFGAYHHYVMVSPDNINYLPGTSAEADRQFAISAGAIALLELGSTLYGAFCLGSRRALSLADAQQTVGRERRERVS